MSKDNKYSLVVLKNCYSLDEPIRTLTEHIKLGGTFDSYTQYKKEYLQTLQVFVNEHRSMMNKKEWESAIYGSLFFVCLLFSLAMLIK